MIDVTKEKKINIDISEEEEEDEYQQLLNMIENKSNSYILVQVCIYVLYPVIDITVALFKN